MANFFQFSAFSSFRMVNEAVATNKDPRYETLPLDSIVDESSYAQPWRKDDTNARIQVLSSYSDDELWLHDYQTDQRVARYPLVPVTPALLNQPYVCMNAQADFSIVPKSGWYYLKYTYTDENFVVQDIRSSPLNIQDDQPGTVLLEGTSPQNAKGTVFFDNNNPIIFAKRMIGCLLDPQAFIEAEDYEDQYFNLTQENAIPFEKYTFYAGDENGIPFWEVKKTNLYFTLPSLKIENQYFTAVDSEFKPTRPTNNPTQFGYWAMTVQPNDNFNYQVYQQGTPPTSTFKVIQLSKDYIGNAADITIASLFKSGIQLDGITIINNSGGGFVLNIGTVAPAGGVYSNDIAQIIVPNADEYHLINHAFRSAQTVYVGPLAGTNCDFHFRYVDYNAPNFVPPTNTTKWVPNTLYTFVEHPLIVGSIKLSDVFNVATGAGIVGTDYENCVLAGTNNTFDPTGKAVVCWDRTNSTDRQVSSGAKNSLIARTNLPNYQLPNRIVLGTSNYGGSGNAISVNQANGNAPATFPFIDLGGSSVPLNVENPNVRFAQFYYIKP